MLLGSLEVNDSRSIYTRTAILVHAIHWEIRKMANETELKTDDTHDKNKLLYMGSTSILSLFSES
jgi:hypothetical protein